MSTGVELAVKSKFPISGSELKASLVHGERSEHESVRSERCR
jgi:hypothetical protein